MRSDQTNSRYPKALIRVINEVALATYQRRALIGLEQSPMGLFRLRVPRDVQRYACPLYART
jgi:hypothetical protein